MAFLYWRLSLVFLLFSGIILVGCVDQSSSDGVRCPNGVLAKDASLCDALVKASVTPVATVSAIAVSPKPSTKATAQPTVTSVPSLTSATAAPASGSVHITNPMNDSFVSGKVKLEWTASNIADEDVSFKYSSNYGGSWQIIARPPKLYADQNLYLNTFDITSGETVLLVAYDVNNPSVQELVSGLTVDNEPPRADCGGQYYAKNGDTVSLSASTSKDSGIGIRSYSWLVNGSQKFSGQTVSYSLAALTGSAYIPVLLNVTDKLGNSATAECEISVGNVAPKPTLSIRNAAEGTPVSFSGDFSDPSKSSGSFSYHWEFGDGEESFGTKSVTHTYRAPGPFTVKFYVDDGETESLAFGVVNISNVKPEVSNLASIRSSDGSSALITWSVTHPAGPSIYSSVEYQYVDEFHRSVWGSACSATDTPYECVWSLPSNPGNYPYRVSVSDGTDTTLLESSQAITVTPTPKPV